MSRARSRLARLATLIGGLLFGVGLLVATELLLRALGAAEEAPRRDPFSGFSRTVRMFEPAFDAAGDRIFRLNPARVPKFDEAESGEPEREFLAKKPTDGFRTFVIGGSSAAGNPYTTRYAFSSWLEHRLKAVFPDRRIEVVNAGLPGYASRRLVPVVHEIAEYKPDLLIVYMGHNEWAESQYYAHLLALPPWLFRVLEGVYETRIYRLAAKAFDVGAEQPPQITTDQDENSRQMFGVLRDRVKGHGYATPREIAYRDLLYENNLRDMAHTIETSGGRVVFVTLSQNFSDWRPPASVHRDDMQPDEEEAWLAHVERGDAHAESGDCIQALRAWDEALALDDRYADLHFRAAGCHRKVGDLVAARDAYRRASDLDPVPHGAPTHFNDLLREVAADHGGLLVDADRALERESGDRLVGDDLFTDFAHPNVRAHQIIAAAIADVLREAGIPEPASRWRDGGYRDPDIATLYREHPELRTLEMSSRVLVCLVAPRDDCVPRANELLSVAPESWVALAVLARLDPDSRVTGTGLQSR